MTLVKGSWSLQWLERALCERLPEELGKLARDSIDTVRPGWISPRASASASWDSTCTGASRRRGKSRVACVLRINVRTKPLRRLYQVFWPHRSQPAERVVAKFNPTLGAWVKYVRIG